MRLAGSSAFAPRGSSEKNALTIGGYNHTRRGGFLFIKGNFLSRSGCLSAIRPVVVTYFAGSSTRKMVVSTPAKACDAHGHCFKEALRCSMASVSQTCSSVKRLSHEATALCRHTSGTLANLGANNSVQQRSDDTCFGRTLCLRQCSFEISACRPYEGNEEPLEAPRISTHSQAAAMPSLEEISSVSTAELETAETCKIVRIFSSLQQGKLAANIHSPEQENTACTPVRLVWGQRGNEIWHLIGCNEGRQNVVYRASRCRPLVRVRSLSEGLSSEGCTPYVQGSWFVYLRHA